MDPVYPIGTSLVRVKLDPTKKTDWSCFVFDLFIDEMNRVVKKVPMLGLCGNWVTVRKSAWPLIYQPGGLGARDKCDFGTLPIELDTPIDLSDKERFAETNLSSKMIKLGEYVTFWYNDDEQCYRISDITKLM